MLLIPMASGHFKLVSIHHCRLLLCRLAIYLLVFDAPSFELKADQVFHLRLSDLRAFDSLRHVLQSRH